MSGSSLVSVVEYEMREALIQACTTQNFEKVQEILSDYPHSVSWLDKDQCTPLLLTSKYGNNEKIADLLLEKGVNIEAQDQGGATSLHYASESGQEMIVKCLLKKGANFDAQTKNGWTSLHIATNYGNYEIVKLLLEKGANIHAQNKDGWTPLHIALRYGKDEIARLLLENGANIHSTTKEKWTPLHFAAGYGDTEIVESLLEKGANLHSQSKKRKWTPLHLASFYGKDENARLLLEKGAMIYVEDKNGKTPFDLAYHKSNYCIAEQIEDIKRERQEFFEGMRAVKLKEELAKRGLATAGLKRHLIERLAQYEEEKRVEKEKQKQKKIERIRTENEVTIIEERNTRKRQERDSSCVSSPSPSPSFPFFPASKRQKTSSLSPSTSPSPSSSTSFSSPPSFPSYPSSKHYQISSQSPSPYPPSSSSVSPFPPTLLSANTVAFKSFNDPPPSRCFNHSPKLNFEDSVRALLLGFEGEKPQNVDDLFVASKDDVYCLISRCKRALRAKRGCGKTQTLVEKMGENSALAIIAYTCESPYPLHKWLNAWLSQGRDDAVAQNNVGPFFRLFYQGLEHLPTQTQAAIREIQVVPQLRFFQNLYDHPPQHGSELAFWGVPSFLEGTHLEVEGEGEEKKIIYRCARLNCVSLECLSIVQGKGGERMPLTPAMFRVIGSEKVESKLVIELEHMTEEHYVDAYVQPSSCSSIGQ